MTRYPGQAAKLPLAALLLALAACGASEGDQAAAPAKAVAEANAQVAAPAAVAPPPAATQAAAPPIVLAAGGFSAGGKAVKLGATADVTVAALSRALGKLPTERGANEECSGGPMTYAQWDGNFYVWFSEDKFAGWDDRGRFRTASGIGIGSRRPDIAGLPGLTIEDTSLGTEFTSGDLSGLLASEAADAKVTALWSGYACAIR